MPREDDTGVNSTEPPPQVDEIFLAYPKTTSHEPNPKGVLVQCTKVETSAMLDSNGEEIFYIYFKAAPGQRQTVDLHWAGASS